ncbi:MAG TPA: glycosyltransferase family 1 protein [Anaeromyxobacter sp.]
MRVLFDHQAFEYQPWGGVSRYHAELVRGLAGRVEVELALVRSHNVYVPDLARRLGLEVSDRGFRDSFLSGRRFPGRKQLYSVAKRLFPSMHAQRANREHALARLRAGGFDLFHPTYYDPYFLDALGDRPFVITVHDMAHDVFPDLFPGEPVAARRRLLVKRASRILAVSESTKRELVRILRTDPSRIDVIAHGFAWAAEPAPPPPLPERYLLYTGMRHGYKNWPRFVEAAAPVLLAERGLHLVCTGPSFEEQERALLERLRLASRVVHVAASEGTLRAIYAGAVAFCFPSRYEGFGIPVLEAFAEGCPAALARTTSLPEVGGDAAIYFDPEDVASIRDAVARLVADPALRAELAARGRERVKAFTWQAACARVVESYRRALGERVDVASAGLD